MDLVDPIEPAEQIPRWEFTVDLDGVSFRYRLTWHERTASWYFDLWTAEGEQLLAGERLVADAAIGWRYRTTAWPAGLLVFFDIHDSGAECDYEGLGRTHQLGYYSAAELAAAAAAQAAADTLVVTV